MDQNLLRSYTFFTLSILLFFVIFLFPIAPTIARYLVIVMAICPIGGFYYGIKSDKGTYKYVAILFNVLAFFAVTFFGILLTVFVNLNG
ncbi:hypothetical protein [Bacillus sp. 1P06AnD]|uniref:hypothetical protein n=1 Tax=Bacillus sp. 1P06AnD TaxID=3132208 RepID=UPI0039A244BF